MVAAALRIDLRRRTVFYISPLLDPEEEAEQESNDVGSLGEVSSDLGFDGAASKAIARQALNAGATAENEEWIEHVGRERNLTNPQGYLPSMLRNGVEAPPDEHDRYTRGQHADYIE